MQMIHFSSLEETGEIQMYNLAQDRSPRDFLGPKPSNNLKEAAVSHRVF